MNKYNRQDGSGPFKFIGGMNGPTTFLPLSTKIGGQTRYIKDREAKCLMDNHIWHVYKKVESGSIINVDTLKQEIELGKLDDTNREINPDHWDVYFQFVMVTCHPCVGHTSRPAKSHLRLYTRAWSVQ